MGLGKDRLIEEEKVEIGKVSTIIGKVSTMAD